MGQGGGEAKAMMRDMRAKRALNAADVSLVGGWFTKNKEEPSYGERVSDRSNVSWGFFRDSTRL